MSRRYRPSLSGSRGFVAACPSHTKQRRRRSPHNAPPQGPPTRGFRSQEHPGRQADGQGLPLRLPFRSVASPVAVSVVFVFVFAGASTSGGGHGHCLAFSVVATWNGTTIHCLLNVSKYLIRHSHRLFIRKPSGLLLVLILRSSTGDEAGEGKSGGGAAQQKFQIPSSEVYNELMVSRGIYSVPTATAPVPRPPLTFEFSSRIPYHSLPPSVLSVVRNVRSSNASVLCLVFVLLPLLPLTPCFGDTIKEEGQRHCTVGLPSGGVSRTLRPFHTVGGQCIGYDGNIMRG